MPLVDWTRSTIPFLALLLLLLHPRSTEAFTLRMGKRMMFWYRQWPDYRIMLSELVDTSYLAGAEFRRRNPLDTAVRADTQTCSSHQSFAALRFAQGRRAATLGKVKEES